MNTVNYDAINRIVSKAQLLQSQYDDFALYGLLDGELRRLERTRVLVLAHDSAKEIIKEFLINLGDEIRDHSQFTTATATLLAIKAVDYLGSRNIIEADKILLYEFVAAISVALVMNALYKQWDSFRDSSNR
ncbi:MAG: hypothetical protein KC415_05520 [Anaerolineales bacterium]|nr:hypothetical protein [Anaerolineales bacterium]MCA9933360.1 hypothetical protein [Anaerolineales bacterium]